MSYADIHTHILYGVDHGAQTIDESIAMLQTAYDEDVRNIICTPHFGLSNVDYRNDVAENNFKRLQEVAREKFPDMNLYMGNELYWSQGIVDSLKRGEAKTLADSDYVLVEFSEEVEQIEIVEAVQRLKWSGYIPIIAHIERYSSLVGKPEEIRQLIKLGAYIQVNIRSFRPPQKKGVFRGNKRRVERRNWCIELANKRLIHFIASDSHDNEIRRPVYRSMSKQITDVLGKEYAEQLQKNTDSLLRKERIL